MIIINNKPIRNSCTTTTMYVLLLLLLLPTFFLSFSNLTFLALLSLLILPLLLFLALCLNLFLLLLLVVLLLDLPFLFLYLFIFHFLTFSPFLSVPFVHLFYPLYSSILSSLLIYLILSSHLSYPLCTIQRKSTVVWIINLPKT